MTFPILSTKYDHVNIFINELAPVVCNEYLKRRDVGEKLITPATVLAQAAKESGWNLNAATLFGIKGEGRELDTTEYIDGEYVHVKDCFAAYHDIAASVQGYYDLMQWDNYDDATAANTVEGELYGLTNAVDGTDKDSEGNYVGYNYATAPDYYQTTLDIINDFGLRAFNDYVFSYNKQDDESKSTQIDENIVDAIYRGEWGNGDERRERLNAAGYNYADYQARVEEKFYSNADDTYEQNDNSGKEERTATVQPGGSFWQIANDYLGDGNRAAELAEYNNMTLESGLYAGMILKLPD